MRGGMWLGLLIGMATLPVAEGRASTAAPAKAPRFEAVTLVIRHRVFHDFSDLQKVKLNQDFILGDTDFQGRVVQFVPDFRLDLATHKVVSLSNQPNNPAFKIIVRQGKTPKDTTWAFLNMPPHFARHSYFAFQVVRIDFVGHEPMMADSTVLTPMPPAGPGAGAAHAPSTAAPKDSADRR